MNIEEIIKQLDKRAISYMAMDEHKIMTHKNDIYINPVYYEMRAELVLMEYCYNCQGHSAEELYILTKYLDGRLK